MAKQQSFAEKAAKKNKKDLSTYVKYIKSVKSDKTGYWRFNEQMIEVKEGENLDGALKRIDEVTQVFDIENPVVEAATDVETVEKDMVNDPKDYKQAADDNGQEELADIVAEESAIETNEPATEEQEKPEPETDETATTENDQESGATEGEEAAVEKENDADETVEPNPEDVGTVTEEQAENAGASGKDMQTNANESA